MYFGYFDGACKGNPGPIGLGIALYGGSQEIAVGAGPSAHGTNNEAEYMALLKLLETALALNVQELCAFGDSQLVINQINGKFSVGEKLKSLHKAVIELASHFAHVEFRWIPRVKNKRADTLSKRGLALSEWNLKIKSNNDTEKQNETPRKLTKKETSVRLGKRFSVIATEATLVVYDNLLNKCSCNATSCEHREYLFPSAKSA